MKVVSLLDKSANYYYKFRKAIKRNPPKIETSIEGLDVFHNYLICTELGIFHLTKGKIKQLTSSPGYSLIVNADKAYAAFERTYVQNISVKQASFVSEFKLQDLLDGKIDFRSDGKMGRVLHRMPFSNSNGRIHQISFWRDAGTKSNSHLMISETDRNCIFLLNLSDDSNKTIYPFSDHFSSPIRDWDHNHINSVVCVDGIIYFVAYKGLEDASFIGYLKDQKVFGWHAHPRGFHDLIPTSTGFLTCDTFGRDEHGRLLDENGYRNQEFFEQYDMAPRGIVCSDEELLVGHSHKGPRSKRYLGKGGLILINSVGEPKYYEMPWSQTYSIIPEKELNGIYSVSSVHSGHKKLRESLNKRFGNEAEICKYTELTK